MRFFSRRPGGVVWINPKQGGLPPGTGPMDDPVPPGYVGTILRGGYSASLCRQVAMWIERCRGFDELEGPAVPYLAAWAEDRSAVWYEYAGQKLVGWLGCHPREAAETFRQKIVEHRTYAQSPARQIEKQCLDGGQIASRRPGLRRQSGASGRVEAVYKLRLGPQQTIWLKDQAHVALAPADGVSLALGCLTDVSKEMELEARCERLIDHLRQSLSRIKTLEGLLPICAACKKVRDDKGYWNRIEDYIHNHTQARFSHGICPDCAQRLYPELYAEGTIRDNDSARLRDDVVDIEAFLKNL